MGNGAQCANTNDLDQKYVYAQSFLARHSGYTKQKEATELAATFLGSYLFSFLA